MSFRFFHTVNQIMIYHNTGLHSIVYHIINILYREINVSYVDFLFEFQYKFLLLLGYSKNSFII